VPQTADLITAGYAKPLTKVRVSLDLIAVVYTIRGRVDEDVLAFFKRGGPGYQGRMNTVLRHFVTEQSRKRKERA
jgi:uncharacterized protein (DUF4415 family)